MRGATDITGYGLLGHAYELAQASGGAIRFRADALPLLDGAREYARKQQIPGGAGRNQLYLEGKVEFARALDDDLNQVLFYPQTSGGLLIAVPETKLDALARALKSRGIEYWVIGEMIDARGKMKEAARILVA